MSFSLYSVGSHWTSANPSATSLYLIDHGICHLRRIVFILSRSSVCSSSFSYLNILLGFNSSRETLLQILLTISNRHYIFLRCWWNNNVHCTKQHSLTLYPNKQNSKETSLWNSRSRLFRLFRLRESAHLFQHFLQLSRLKKLRHHIATTDKLSVNE